MKKINLALIITILVYYSCKKNEKDTNIDFNINNVKSDRNFYKDLCKGAWNFVDDKDTINKKSFFIDFRFSRDSLFGYYEFISDNGDFINVCYGKNSEQGFSFKKDIRKLKIINETVIIDSIVNCCNFCENRFFKLKIFKSKNSKTLKVIVLDSLKHISTLPNSCTMKRVNKTDVHISDIDSITYFKN